MKPSYRETNFNGKYWYRETNLMGNICYNTMKPGYRKNNLTGNIDTEKPIY